MDNNNGFSVDKSLHIVIFSKDRALQCDSLLRSLADNFNFPISTISILYKATLSDFDRAYDILQKQDLLKGISWVREISFRNDLLNICKSFPEDSFVMFLVDDTIIFKKIELSPILSHFSDRHLFVSLRASQTYSDIQPSFSNISTCLEWKWNYLHRKFETWNYPFSVDGNIFSTKTIIRVLNKTSFKSPNTLEGAMHVYRHSWWIKRLKWALAPTYPVLFNNPLNKVQTDGETWHMAVSLEYLNQKYLSGFRIDNNLLYSVKPSSTHHPVNISFKVFS